MRVARPDVAVIGGGIGGLTTALVLDRFGLPFRVFEQAPTLREIGAGVGLWPAALRVFDRLGLGADVRALGRAWEVGGLRRSDGAFLVRYSADEFAAVFGEPTIAVHRGELQSLLVERVGAARVSTGTRLTALRDEPGDPVQLRFENGATGAAGLVVGADGMRSIVRRARFGVSALAFRHYISWRGTAAQPAGTDWHVHAGETWGTGGRFGFIPISQSRVTWYAAANGVEVRDRAEVERRFGEWHHPIPEIIAATSPSEVWCDRIFDRRPLAHWTAGRVALLGDAAHPMTPELGQGACQAVLDAWALGARLADEPSVEAGLRAYERDRRLGASTISTVARAIAIGGRLDTPAFSRLRETTLAVVPPRLFLAGLARLCDDGGWRRRRATTR